MEVNGLLEDAGHGEREDERREGVLQRLWSGQPCNGLARAAAGSRSLDTGISKSRELFRTKL